MKIKPSNEPGKIFLKTLKDIFFANSRLLAPITCSILTKLKLAKSVALTMLITKNEKRIITKVSVINITNFSLETIRLKEDKS